MDRSIRRGMLAGLLAIGSGAYAQPAPSSKESAAPSADFEKGYQDVRGRAKTAFEDDKTFDLAKALKQLDELGKLASADQKTRIADLRLALPKIEALRVPKASANDPKLLDAEYAKKVTALAPEFDADAAKAVGSRKLQLAGPGKPVPAANPLTPEELAARNAKDAQSLSQQANRSAKSQSSAQRIIAGFGPDRSAEEFTGAAGSPQGGRGIDAASGLHAADFNPRQKLAPTMDVPAAAAEPVAAPGWWDRAKSLGKEYSAKGQDYATAKAAELKETGKEVVAGTVATAKQLGASTMTGLGEVGTVLTTPLHGVKDSYGKYAAGRMAASENLQQEGGALLEKGGVANTLLAGWKATEAFGDRVLAADPKTIKQVAIGAAVAVAVVVAAPAVIAAGATIAAGGAVAGVVAGTTAVVQGGLAAVTTYGVIHGTAVLAKDPNLANAGLLALNVVPIPFIGKISEAAGKVTGKVVEKVIALAERNAETSSVAAGVTGIVAVSAKSISKVEAAESRAWANKVAEKAGEKLTEKGIEHGVVEPSKEKLGEVVAETSEHAEKVPFLEQAAAAPAAEPAYGVFRGAFRPQLALAVP